MSDTAYLILENGKYFKGKFFGAKKETTGEVVFTTGMTGYLETLTDQSYYGQIILQTFPLIGNYGVIPSDFESGGIGANGYIVRELCTNPSNFRSEGALNDLLINRNITGLCGVDTRAITKIIRENGVINGRITNIPPEQCSYSELTAIKQYRIENAVAKVSVKKPEVYSPENIKHKIVLLDFGVKENIKRELLKRDCEVWVLPHDSNINDILSVNPDGIMLSNGPGDPAENVREIENLKGVIEAKIPTFGICLGHQLLALAYGYKTHKLKYGHRGTNQPVKEQASGRTYITSQNHGYAVDIDSISEKTGTCSYINTNDNTCEGIEYKNQPVLSVQFHPEAYAGPLDTAFLFDRFLKMVSEYK